MTTPDQLMCNYEYLDKIEKGNKRKKHPCFFFLPPYEVMNFFSFALFTAALYFAYYFFDDRLSSKDDGNAIDNRTKSSPTYNQIILLGDSITQQGCSENNWVWKLACAYVRKADVINRGFSGNLNLKRGEGKLVI